MRFHSVCRSTDYLCSLGTFLTPPFKIKHYLLKRFPHFCLVLVHKSAVLTRKSVSSMRQDITPSHLGARVLQFTHSHRLFSRILRFLSAWWFVPNKRDTFSLSARTGYTTSHDCKNHLLKSETLFHVLTHDLAHLHSCIYWKISNLDYQRINRPKFA